MVRKMNELDTAMQIHDHTHRLINMLEHKPTAPPDNPRVTELIEAGRGYVQWVDRNGLTGTTSPEYQALRSSVVAFDPPDPDAELVERIAEFSCNDWGAYTWNETNEQARERWRERARNLLAMFRP